MSSTNCDTAFAAAFKGLWQRQRVSLGAETCVVIRLGDDLHHCYDGNIEAVPVVGATYHALKRAAHLPLRAWVLRVSSVAGAERPTLDDAVIREIETLDNGKNALKEILSHIEMFWLATDEGLGWQQVQDLAHGVHAPVQELIRTAANLEIQRLHKAVCELERNTPEKPWHLAYFCVVGGKEPRYKELSKQYFDAYLKNHGSARGGRRHQLVYAEGDHTLESVFDLIAKRDVSRTLGEVFTGSSTGLEEDVLGDAASIAIERIFSYREDCGNMVNI